MEGKKEMLKEEMRQRKREQRGGQDAVEDQRCVPPPTP